MKKTETTEKRMPKPKDRPKYEPPKVVTYSKDDILKLMGPVGGCVSPIFDPGSPD